MKLEPILEPAIRLDWFGREPNGLMLEQVRQRASEFDFLRFTELRAETACTLSVVKRVGDVDRTRWVVSLPQTQSG